MSTIPEVQLPPSCHCQNCPAFPTPSVTPLGKPCGDDSQLVLGGRAQTLRETRAACSPAEKQVDTPVKAAAGPPGAQAAHPALRLSVTAMGLGLEMALCQATFLPQNWRRPDIAQSKRPDQLTFPKTLPPVFPSGRRVGKWYLRGGGRYSRDAGRGARRGGENRDAGGDLMAASVALKSGSVAATSVVASRSPEAPKRKERLSQRRLPTVEREKIVAAPACPFKDSCRKLHLLDWGREPPPVWRRAGKCGLQADAGN